MSIVVNGTTIPTNVANALNVNGTNITSVICNGTTVWTQSLIVRQPASGEYYVLNGTGNYCWIRGVPSQNVYWAGVQVASGVGVNTTNIVVSGWRYYRGTQMETDGNIYYAIYRISV